MIPGVRDFRLLTSGGASTTGQVVLTRDPVFHESGENDTLEKAQAVALPATVCGTIEKAEDIDCFKFTAVAGQTLSFHVRSQRLQNRLHDMQTAGRPDDHRPQLAMGSTLAASDNVYAGDPLLVQKFEQAGEYVLEVRDVRYQGNADWTYCVEVNDRPFVTQTHPLAVAAGIESKLALVGANLPADPTLPLTCPRRRRTACGGSRPRWVERRRTPLPRMSRRTADSDRSGRRQQRSREGSGRAVSVGDCRRHRVSGGS